MYLTYRIKMKVYELAISDVIFHTGSMPRLIYNGSLDFGSIVTSPLE